MAVMNLQRLRLRCSNVSSNCRESQARRWSMSGRITLRRAGPYRGRVVAHRHRRLAVPGATSDGSGPGTGQSIRTAGRAPSGRQGLHGRVYIGRRRDGVQRRAWVCVIGRQISARRRVTAGFELRLGAMTRESPQHRHCRAHLDASRRRPELTLVRYWMGPRKSRLPRSTPFFRNSAYAIVT